MAPVNQLGVLAFASAVLAVPHAQWQPFKRHAHPSIPVYGGSSSAPVDPISSSAPAVPSGSAPVYPSGSFSYDPTSSSVAAVSESGSAPAYPSGSGSSVDPVSTSSSWSVPVYPSGSASSISVSPVSSSTIPSATPTPTCWTACFAEAGITSESDLCGNTEVDKCICDTCDSADDKAYWAWYESYCGVPNPSASTSVYPSFTSSHGAFSFPSSGYSYPSSSYVAPTGYSAAPTGYSSAFPSYSTCTETSTLIYRSTTEYSTYYVTHTIYESPASSVAPASVGGFDSASAPGYTAPASAPAYGAPSASSAGADAGGSCVPDVTVTATVQTTVYVTLGAPSGDAPVPSTSGSFSGFPSSLAAVPSSEAAPSYPAGAPSSAPTYSAGAPSSAPSSAAAPSYSAPPSSGPSSGKRGVAYNDASLANTFAGSKAGSWGYNWISNSDGLDSSIPYIPMLHDASSAFTSVWQADASSGIANGAQYLFSFNEPDMSTQANLSPNAAAAAWKQYMEPFAGQAKLIAPAVTNGQGTGIGLDWLNQFLSACSDCTIDSVAMHWYFPGSPVDTFKEQITAMATATGKGIWLSEFGADGSDEDKAAFLNEVLPWLDSNDSILGYSYFMVSDGLLMSGDAPSSYGQVYAGA